MIGFCCRCLRLDILAAGGEWIKAENICALIVVRNALMESFTTCAGPECTSSAMTRTVTALWRYGSQLRGTQAAFQTCDSMSRQPALPFQVIHLSQLLPHLCAVSE